MSIEQKRLQLATKFSDVVVGLANPGWQTVPEPLSSGCEAPIAEPCVGPWNAARVDVGRSEPATSGVRDKLAVVYKICCSCIMQRLVDQEGQLELDSLSDWKPVELPQHWRPCPWLVVNRVKYNLHFADVTLGEDGYLPVSIIHPHFSVIFDNS